MMAVNLSTTLKYKYHSVEQLNVHVKLAKYQYLKRNINTILFILCYILYTYFWPTLYLLFVSDISEALRAMLMKIHNFWHMLWYQLLTVQLYILPQRRRHYLPSKRR
jgi:hypothetical protein